MRSEKKSEAFTSQRGTGHQRTQGEEGIPHNEERPTNPRERGRATTRRRESKEGKGGSPMN